MAKRELILCDACADAGTERDGHVVYLGFSEDWWQLDLCDDHEVSLLGELEGLLDAAGMPAPGPELHV